MTRIRLHIDRLVLNGFQRLDGNALAEALQAQLSESLSEPTARTEWARSHETPVLRLGQMPLGAGASGAREFGRQMGRAVARGLRP